MQEPNFSMQLQMIQQKLKTLLDKHSALQKEKRQLQIEKENLQKQIAYQNDQIKKLEQQNDVLKSGIQHWHPEQKKLFIKRIDSYLKEIEKCLALIND
ncbi:MAG: hypothetical protein M3R72_10565 [Bacteroidota bacterium]|nr:hypothetical protein [Bacteroidota bacterium]